MPIRNTYFRKFGGIEFKPIVSNEGDAGEFDGIKEIPNPLVSTKYDPSSANEGSIKVAENQHTGIIAERITDDTKYKGYGFQMDVFDVNGPIDISKNVYNADLDEDGNNTDKTYTQHRRDTFAIYPEYENKQNKRGNIGLIVDLKGSVGNTAPFYSEESRLLRLEREIVYLKTKLDVDNIRTNTITGLANIVGKTGSNISILGNTDITGTLNVNKDVSLNENLMVNGISTFHKNIFKQISIPPRERNNMEYLPNLKDIRDIFYPVGSVSQYFGKRFHKVKFTNTGYLQCIPETGWLLCNGAELRRVEPYRDLYDQLKLVYGYDLDYLGPVQLPNIDASFSPVVSNDPNASISIVIFSGKFNLSSVQENFGISGELVFDFQKYLFLGQDCVYNSNTQELVVVGTTSYGDADGNLAIAIIPPDGNNSNVILRYFNNASTGQFGVHVEYDELRDCIYVTGSTLSLNKDTQERNIHTESFYFYVFRMVDIRNGSIDGTSQIIPLFNGNLLRPPMVVGEQNYRYLSESGVIDKFPNPLFILSSLEMKLSDTHLFLVHKQNNETGGERKINMISFERNLDTSIDLETNSLFEDLFKENTVSLSYLKYTDAIANVDDIQLGYMIPYDIDVYQEEIPYIDLLLTDVDGANTSTSETVFKKETKEIFVAGKRDISGSYVSCLRKYNTDASFSLDVDFNNTIATYDISDAVSTSVVCDVSYVYEGGIIDHNDKKGSFFITKYNKNTGIPNTDLALRKDGLTTIFPEYLNNHVILDMNENMYDLVTCMTIDHARNLIIIGRISSDNGKGDIVVHKIKSDGFYDVSFGDNGIKHISVDSISYSFSESTDDGIDNRNAIPTRVFVDTNNFIYITGHINDFQTFIIKLDQYGRPYTINSVFSDTNIIGETEKKYFKYSVESNVKRFQEIMNDGERRIQQIINDFKTNDLSGILIDISQNKVDISQNVYNISQL